MNFIEWFKTQGGPKRAWHRRLVLDATLLVILSSVMLDRYTGNLIHEVFGIAMVAIFGLHVLLNAQWYSRAFGIVSKIANPSRERNIKNGLLIVVNILLAASFIASILSGLMCSQTVLSDLTPDNWRMDLKYRAVHVGLSIWFFIFAAIHAGLHMGVYLGKISQWLQSKFGEFFVWMISIISVATAFYMALSAFEPRQADLLMSFKNAYIPVDRDEWGFAMPLDLFAVFVASSGITAICLQMIKVFGNKSQ